MTDALRQAGVAEQEFGKGAEEAGHEVQAAFGPELQQAIAALAASVDKLGGKTWPAGSLLAADFASYLEGRRDLPGVSS